MATQRASESQEPGTGTLNCPVCWCELAGEVRACRRCRTLHHDDCISFVGQCAIFGCGGDEFETVEARGAALAIPRMELDGEAAASSPPPSPARRLGRGPLARFAAAVRLLASNPGIALPLASFLVLFDLVTFGSAFKSVVAVLAQVMLVVTFLARARGKEASFRHALSLANQRGGRIILCGIGAFVLGFAPLIVGLSLVAGGLMQPSPGWLAAGAVLLGLGLHQWISYSLVGIVAAMGTEEEPGDALQRSRELVRVGFGQAAMASVLCILLPPILAALGSAAGLRFELLQALNSCFTVVIITYWFLFYVEARRVLQTTYLPFAPPGLLPEPPPGP